jgi:hypothetical protein
MLPTIPNKCRPLFRDLGNELFASASTGLIAAIKAAWMFARLILFCPSGHRGKQNSKLVSNRLEFWSAENFEALVSDLLNNRDCFPSHSKSRDLEKTRNSRVLFNRVRVGELSKGLQ